MWTIFASKRFQISRYWQSYLFLISSASWSCMGHSSSTPMANTPLVIPPTGRHTATVIFLHGLGDTGHGWAEAFKAIKKEHIKYIFPNAEYNSVTLNGGMKMPSWFDLYSLSPGGQEDEPGIKKATADLTKLIEEEEKQGISSEQICIGGFSQGGAVALHTGLTSKKKVGCIVALSSWLPLATDVEKALQNLDKKYMPILQCHGKADPIVCYKIGEMTQGVVKKFCPNHCFESFDGMGHSSCPEEMKLISQFLDKTFPKTSS